MCWSDYQIVCYSLIKEQVLVNFHRVDKFDYKLPYPTIFGGVTALQPQQFKKVDLQFVSSKYLKPPPQVNGYSNMFWGWGGEDDDMYNRVIHHGLKVVQRLTAYNPALLRVQCSSVCRW